MRWCDYYEKINYWSVSTAVNKISSLEDMGEPNEIVDALIIIAYEDKKGANKLLNRALQQDIKFSGDNLIEITGICVEEDFKKALYQSADTFTVEDLENLYGCIDTALIIDVAKQFKIPVPKCIADEEIVEPVELLPMEEFLEDLTEEDEEQIEDFSIELQSVISAANYALACLAQAQRALNESNNVSFIDMVSKNSFTSVWKYSTLSMADVELQQAQDALCSLNAELKILQNNKSVKLKSSRLANEIDMWMNAGFLDVFTHLQINKAQKQIRQAIAQVNKIYKELVKILG